MPIQTTERYQLTTIRMAITKKSTNRKCWRGCGDKGTLRHYWWEWKSAHLLWTTSRRVLKKLKNRATIWPGNPTPREYIQRETWPPKDACTPEFTAVLFTIARTWNPPKCPSAEEWVKKTWNIYTTEYYWAVKKNEIKRELRQHRQT